MNALRAIAVHCFTDILRSRILYSIVAYAAVVMLVAVLAGEWTLGEEVRLVTDLGLGAMLLFGLLLVLTRGAETISREVERKTVRVMLARPIERWHFVVGSYLGMAMVLLLLVAALLAVLVVALLPMGGSPSWTLAVASWGVFLELLMVAAVALLASNLSSPVLATLLTLLVVFAGHLATGLRAWMDGGADIEHLSPAERELAAAYQAGPLNVGLRLGYYVLPIVAHVNFKTEVANALPVPVMRLILGTAYALVYSGIMVLVATAVFRRRDVS
ncbi:MAG: ABC transporter permease subunit [Candidatus Eisenbacteria bacterium]|jgi:ABC-type transport system involved in multi-copper enzyme maturation permease subunit|nr:ABC transporter permease subunit [Candidatus Eisenbacteria bacterium]